MPGPRCVREAGRGWAQRPLRRARGFLPRGSSRTPVSSGPATGPAALPHRHLAFPEAFCDFQMLPSVHRVQRQQDVPLPAGGIVSRGAKFTDASEAGPREASQSESRSQSFPLPWPRITKLECVPPKGRCYGDFINNIAFRIRVP